MSGPVARQGVGNLLSSLIYSRWRSGRRAIRGTGTLSFEKRACLLLHQHRVELNALRSFGHRGVRPDMRPRADLANNMG